MKKGQIYTGFILLAAMVVFGIFQAQKNNMLAFHLIIGLSIGYILQRSRFGFAGGVRRIYLTGDSSLTKALLFLFSITLLATAAVHYGAYINGADVYFRAVESGVAIIPGSDYVEPANIATILGGLMFGIGMMFGGGCASGTLSDAGEGEGRGLIVLFFFCTGALWGAHDMPAWKESIFFDIHSQVYLPDVFGFSGAVIVSLLGFLILYIIAKKYENKRIREGNHMPLQYEEWEKEIPESKDTKYKFFSYETYHKFFIKRWSFYTGAVLISIMFMAILVVTGTSWGVTAIFARWAAWFYGIFGLDVTTWGFFSGQLDILEGGFLNDPGSMRNMGIILGALISSLLTGRFVFKRNFKSKDILFYVIAGLLMGYGARIALGCNVGALYSGISNMSLSGWVFLPSLVIGGIIGIKLVKKLNINV